MIGLATPSPAPVVHSVVSNVVNHSLTIPSFWLTFLIGAGLPFVVDLITKREAPSWFKSAVLTVLAAVAGWLTSLNATGGTFTIKAAFTSAVLTFLTAHGIHAGLLSQLGITGSSGVIQSVLPSGVGPGGSTTAAHAATPVTPPADKPDPGATAVVTDPPVDDSTAAAD
jgi:hypothetical protein